MAKQPRDLSGKVIVITGGARGIGAATARALVAVGAKVVIGDLDEELTQKVAGEIRATGYRLDVTDHAGFTKVLDQVEADLGPVYALVNNAGIMPLALIEDESEATMDRQLAINLAAVIHGTREAVKRMKPRRSGHIVNVASLAGKLGTPGAATYCATKHGVVGLSEAVYFELKPFNVDVTCIMPTIVATELAAGLKKSALSGQVQPEDVANAIVRSLQRPKLEVTVPGYLGTVARIVRVFPRRVGDTFAKVGGTDKLLASAAHSPARAAYEARAVESAPGIAEL
ncbi:SDR family oxidoreductase [Jatrophihabitans sp.]|uniref:SDR family oxidoreductase n=1 Tax=Jatrophihabitans sp. TaxID=1932789 RepID=UPI0030C765C9|nr:short-chain dehydrogenase/reductase [Jatrophihabitans sp.]